MTGPCHTLLGQECVKNRQKVEVEIAKIEFTHRPIAPFLWNITE